MSTTTIDLTPTWQEILPALITLLENPRTHQVALDELSRMAGLADEYVHLFKEMDE